MTAATRAVVVAGSGVAGLSPAVTAAGTGGMAALDAETWLESDAPGSAGAPAAGATGADD